MIYEFGEHYTVRTNHIKWTAKTRPLTLCRVPKARICITCLCFSLFLHACLNHPSAFSAILFILTSAVISYPDLLTHFALAAIFNTFPSSLEILVTWFCCVPGSSPEPPPYWKARRPWGRGCTSPLRPYGGVPPRGPNQVPSFWHQQSKPHKSIKAEVFRFSNARGVKTTIKELQGHTRLPLQYPSTVLWTWYLCKDLY